MDEYHIPKSTKPTTDFSRFKVVKGNRGSARGELLDRFLARLNAAREGTKYKPLTIKRLATMLSHVPTTDLHAFYRQCEKSDIPFSAYFHWSLKVQKESCPNHLKAK